jgi:hypothetical protein
MTGLSPFEPGNELQCDRCEMQLEAGRCVLALELADDGEVMGPSCCPEGHSCPVCGGPLPCRSCLAELRCDA